MNLANKIGEVMTATANFSKYGSANADSVKTTCISNVKVGGEVLDHLWVKSSLLAATKLVHNKRYTLKVKLIKSVKPAKDLYAKAIKTVGFNVLEIKG